MWECGAQPRFGFYTCDYTANRMKSKAPLSGALQKIDVSEKTGESPLLIEFT